MNQPPSRSTSNTAQASATFLPPAPGPFVINLCASTAPMAVPMEAFAGLPAHRMFQVRRIEDDRPRYRLRLGFFVDEASAEQPLDIVRERFPAAFCVQAGTDDLRHAGGFVWPEPVEPTMPEAALTDVSPQPEIHLMDDVPPAQPVVSAMAAPGEPLRLATNDAVVIDNTQTLRLLTQAEIADGEGPKWYALQLAISEQPVNLDAMPRLDIFSAFHLYSVAGTQEGLIVHSLRLGFFREEVSAQAVAGYLKVFFASPGVIRISNSEHARFAEPPKAVRAAAETPPMLTDRLTDRGANVVPLASRPRAPADAKPPVLTKPMLTKPVLTNTVTKRPAMIRKDPQRATLLARLFGRPGP